MDIDALYASINRRYRARRMARMAETFALTDHTRILDVGGTRYLWSMLPVTPRVVLLNLLPPGDRPPGGDAMVDVLGDARSLPFADQSFDLAFSNSLIDHLYTFEGQRRFANECRRIARRYYVQGPCLTFPVEPHLLTPFVHWLPKPARRRLLRRFTVWGLLTRPNRQECDQFIDEVRLLTPAAMRKLFPEAEIWRERVLGLTKSVMAVKATD
jgi:hypothetical protein